MAITADQLGKDEYVIATMRTHVKKLIIPVLFLFAIAIVLGVAIALFPAGWQPWATWIAVVAALIAFVVLVVRPALGWWSSTYTVTNRRIILEKRADILNIPLNAALIDTIVLCRFCLLHRPTGQ